MLVLFSIGIGLFWAAFLAATILPVGSEPALSAALVAGLSPMWCLIVATIGNSAGSVTTFLLGRLGKLKWLEKYCRVTPQDIQCVQSRIERLGGVAAFLCFLPIIGDVLAIALGFMRYSLWKFVVFMTVGKLLRYAIWIALHLYIAEGAK